ncbi:DUF3048 domain-containing protein [Alkalibacter mobilis]|uniref:DUF3048 domain-containing protein n=1 Tax=Alkalibacter mobilis TaxID=2787712 RepID=UPI00189E8C39|nr:DUF3048 domain-containing protein [Alkalibacter mobilis]MBF7095951.1 DUF3048 domain-containing protein [Alkalibacter mobilis]
MKKLALWILIITFLIFTGCSADVEPENENGNGNEPVDPDPIIDPVENIAKYDELDEGISPLTGESYDGESYPMMVQMENTPAARPQSGISGADLIYEIEVESKITRLTAFFHSEFPDKVGPVRSARKQQIHLWSEWNFLFAFYGGSTPAGQNIYEIREELGVTAPMLDGMSSNAFFRTSDRKAPHNAYLKLSDFADDTHKPDRTRTIYFDQELVFEGETAQKISLAYQSINKITYDYDAESGLYKRSINGDPMVDKENGEQVTVKNIIVQRAKHIKVEGMVYTNIDLIGSGESLYFADGKMKKGTWERKDKDSLTVYYDESGEEIPLPAGKTFIQIVRTDLPVDYE